MNKINYHKELEHNLKVWRESDEVHSLLLHSCCAPCSSYCLEFLNPYLDITVFYFNPNITDADEYRFRLDEQKRLISQMPFVRPVKLIEGAYEPGKYFELARGLEDAPERGPRCLRCYRLRLAETARIAREYGFDRFATTLTLSPLKNSEAINSIGLEIDSERYLPTDFKKNNGYLRSIELSKQYNLYRQNYCGCIYSKRGAVPSQD